MAYPDSAGMPGQPGIHHEETPVLTSLLGSLLSLLQHFQASSANPTTARSQLWQEARDTPELSRQQIDRQAAIAFAEDIAADSLRRLSTYCERQGLTPGIEACIDRTTEAAQCYANRDYNGCLFLVWQAYRAVAAARTTNTDLPNLGEQQAVATSGGSPSKLH